MAHERDDLTVDQGVLVAIDPNSLPLRKYVRRYATVEVKLSPFAIAERHDWLEACLLTNLPLFENSEGHVSFKYEW